MKTKMYTAQQWQDVQPLLRSLSLGTVEIARLVLVDGKRPVDVASQVDASRQHVSQCVKKVRAILEDQQGEEGLVPTLLWLPEDVAVQIKTLDHDALLQGLKELIDTARA